MRIGWTEILVTLIIFLLSTGFYRLVLREARRAFRKSGGEDRGACDSGGRPHASRGAYPGDEAGYPPAEGESADPYAVLKIRPPANQSEITSAYRKLAQMYHPDKVAGLAPEYKEIAEKKMKQINAAYQTLKK
ncbi:MAG: J domain-containing protein [Anaerolineales bacterium]|nr:J domain-containing protein [Anaerolineales bacterium]